MKVGVGVERPLDLLFSSAADIFKKNTVGVLLTGIGDDGAEGFTKIRERSGMTIAQSTDTCVYPNLTQNVIERGIVDIMADENDLVREIEAVVK